MLPIPSLSFTGGAGGASNAGDSTAANPVATGFGAFNVGGKGSNVGGGSATASSAAIPTWVWYVVAGGAVLFLVFFLARRK